MNLDQIKEKLDIYVEALRNNRLWIILFALILGGILGFNALTSPTFFIAHASFHPETNSSNAPSLSGSPLSFLLGSGGLDGNEADMMEEVLLSRKISEDVVKDSIMVGTEKRLLADLIIEKYPKGFSLKGFIIGLFISPEEPEYESKVIRAGVYIKNGLEVKKADSGFLNMNLKFNDVKLAEIISQKYIEKLSQYYTDQKTAKAKINLNFFTDRAAFVKRQLDSTATNLANFQDRNKGLLFARKMVSAKEYETKLEYLKEMYKTLVTNREQAASQLQRDTPIIQVLDQPKPPFESVQKSFPLYLFIGLFLGALLGAGWATRKLIWEDLYGYINRSLENPRSIED